MGGVIRIILVKLGRNSAPRMKVVTDGLTRSVVQVRAVPAILDAFSIKLFCTNTFQELLVEVTQIARLVSIRKVVLGAHHQD